MPLEIDTLTRRFGDHVALDHVSLHVRDGDCYGLIGHNGAGKTTLLRIVLGLAPTDRGRVLVDGFDAAAHPREARVRMGGLVEVPGFYGGLGGQENLAMLGRLQGLDRGTALREAREWLERAGLAHAGTKPVRSYSQGMRQRLGIAQALIGRPRYLLLDEPTNGLDPEGIADLRTLLEELMSEGLTILLSSHQLSEVSGLCNRIAVLNRGRLVVEETTRELLAQGAERYHIAGVDLETTQRNLSALGLEPELPGRLERNGGVLVDLEGREPGDIARGLVERGENLRLFAPHEVTLEEIYLTATRAEAPAPEPVGSRREAAGKPEERLAPPRPVLRVWRHDVGRLMRRPMLWCIFATPPLIAAFTVMQRRAEVLRDASEVASGRLASGEDPTAFEGFGFAMRAALPLLGLLLTGLASQSVAGELARGTLRNVALRPVGRWSLAAGKGLACLALGAWAYVALVAAATGCAALAFDFKDVSELLPNGRLYAIPGASAGELWPEFRSALLAPLGALAAYTGLGFFAGSVVRHGATALGLAFGLVLSLDLGRSVARSLDFEGLLPSAYLPSPLGDTSFYHYYIDVARGIGNTSFEHAGGALFVPLAWCVLSFGLGGLVLRRRSIP